MRTEEKKEPITVTYVGRGGVFDTPCYMDQNGRYYFDENNGMEHWICIREPGRTKNMGRSAGSQNTR